MSSSDARSRPPGPISFGSKLLAVGLGFLLVAMVEIALRLIGYAPDQRLFVARYSNGRQTFYQSNPGVVSRLFRRRWQGQVLNAPAPPPAEFEMPKPAGTVRIFVLGESSVAGFPYPHVVAFPAILEHMLTAVHPPHRFEVINTGVHAISSLSLCDFAAEIVDYDPDLVIVYAGHNEYYGAGGVASYMAAGLPVVRSLRLYRALDDALLALSHLWKGGQATGRADLIGVMAQDLEIRLGSPTWQAGIDRFRTHLRAIVRTCTGRGVPIVLATLLANERDTSPMASVHRPDLSPAEAAAWQQAYDRGVTLEDQAQWAEALAAYDQAGRLDDGHALLVYRRARCLERLGRIDEARDAFRRALDLDVVRFRAPTAINQAIRDLARSESVWLADLEAIARQRCPNGILGSPVLCEHVHPTVYGHYLLADGLLRYLADSPWSQKLGRWDLAAIPDQESCEKNLGYTTIDRAFAETKLLRLLDSWPFTTQLSRAERLAAQARLVADLLAQVDPVESRLGEELLNEGAVERIHALLGDHYLQAGDLDRAARAYRLALPRSSNAQALYELLLGIEMARGRHAEAVHLSRELLRRYAPKAIWARNQALALECLGRDDEALAAYRRTVELEVADAASYLSWANLLARKGRLDEAIGVLREGISQADDAEPLRRRLAELQAGSAHR